jgi:MFS family permease
MASGENVNEARESVKVARTAPHPSVWLLLYLPFGALSGFVSVALTFVATGRGLSITEGALLTGAQMVVQWLKWVWAPLVDVTLTPKRWYRFATIATGVGIFAMSAMPMSQATLPYLLVVIALTSLINSVVGMAIEAIIAGTISEKEVGRVSGWFQAGNLGGSGLGGGLGLLLIKYLPAPWMAGAVLTTLYVLCTFGLMLTPDVPPHKAESPGKAIATVVRDLGKMLKTRGGLSAAVLCFLPIGTGAAQSTLAQEKVAATWGAGAREVALMQGFSFAAITAAGCFVGGWVCTRIKPRTAYALIGFLMALVALAMALLPKNIGMYITLNAAYAFVTGLAFAGFTAFVLDGMGKGSGATKYNVFASLSNFPIWWLGLLLGRVADTRGPSAMLLADAGAGIAGVAVFGLAISVIRRTRLPEHAET